MTPGLMTPESALVVGTPAGPGREDLGCPVTRRVLSSTGTVPTPTYTDPLSHLAPTVPMDDFPCRDPSPLLTPLGQNLSLRSPIPGRPSLPGRLRPGPSYFSHSAPVVLYPLSPTPIFPPLPERTPPSTRCSRSPSSPSPGTSLPLRSTQTRVLRPLRVPYRSRKIRSYPVAVGSSSPTRDTEYGY